MNLTDMRRVKGSLDCPKHESFSARSTSHCYLGLCQCATQSAYNKDTAAGKKMSNKNLFCNPAATVQVDRLLSPKTAAVDCSTILLVKLTSCPSARLFFRLCSFSSPLLFK